MRAKNAAEMVRSIRALDEARRMYDFAFEAHATAEQLAVFWSEFDDANNHRVTLQMILQRSEEELNAQPLHKGSW